MHYDLRSENFLWSMDLQYVMIVDFGQSALLEISHVFPSTRYQPKPRFNLVQRKQEDLLNRTAFFSLLNNTLVVQDVPSRRLSTLHLVLPVRSG